VRILIAPDSFKGSLDAPTVARAIGVGVKRARPDFDIALAPMADGGEGTLDVLGAHGMTLLDVPIRDHQGQSIVARIARQGSFVVIEAAQACRFNPAATPEMALTASTEGVGMLVSFALDIGATEIYLTLGGTASTDGGKGMLAHLGGKVVDSAGKPLAPGGGSLAHVAEVDLTGMDERLKTASITVITDVNAPLLGPEGAANQFARQKGADERAVDVLETGLSRFSAVLNPEVAALPGSGSGGGLGFGAVAGLGASSAPGAQTIARIIGLEAALRTCDLVITGEGSFDPQSFGGKLVGFICEQANKLSVPVGVISGQHTYGDDIGAVASREGISWVRTLTDVASDAAEAKEQAEVLLQHVAEIAIRESQV